MRKYLGILALALALAAPALADGIVNGGGGATASGIVTACGASTGQLLYDNAGSCAGSQFSQVSAQVGALSDSTTASGFFAYNTVDTVTSPTNYERGVLDWTTTANVLTIGTQNGGTGTGRNIQIVASGADIGWFLQGTSTARLDSGGPGFEVASNILIGWSSAAANAASPDTSFDRVSAGFAELGNGSTGSANNRDLRLRHLGGGAAAPTANTCAGFALGTGGSDLGGKITLTSATTCSINFGTAFTNAPACTVTPGSAASTTLATTTTGVLSVTFGTAQTAFSYTCIGL